MDCERCFEGRKQRNMIENDYEGATLEKVVGKGLSKEVNFET